MNGRINYELQIFEENLFIYSQSFRQTDCWRKVVEEIYIFEDVWDEGLLNYWFTFNKPTHLLVVYRDF